MPRHLARTFFLILLFLSASTAGAQQIYRVSWTLQDAEDDLQQELAAKLIDSLNFWLTRENPEAQTMRIDDPLRITVTGTYDPRTDQITERVVSMQVDNLVFTDDPRLFLDSSLVDSLLKRNYYWREERVEQLDEELIPEYYASSISVDPDLPPSSREVFQMKRQENQVSLNKTTYSIRNGTSLMGGFGYAEIGLPLFSYKRARIGVQQSGFSVWYEMPIELNISSALSGPNLSSHGAGMSFDLFHAGGSATFSNVRQPSRTDLDTAFMLSKSVLLYGALPIGWFSPLQSQLRIKGGAGLLEETTLVRNESDEMEADASTLIPRFYLQGELQGLREDGTIRRSGSLTIFGETISAIWFERFSNLFGIRGGLTLRGILGEPQGFESRTTIWATPVIFLP